MTSHFNSKTALVLSGGGARGAYEAGILHHFRKKIWPDQHGFQIHSGTSAGAINTCFLAANADNPKKQGEMIRILWEEISSSNIYRGDFKALLKLLFRSIKYSASHAFGFPSFFSSKAPDAEKVIFQGLLDTTPFIPFLKKIIHFKKIRQNISNGFLDAVSISTTNIGSSKLELFIDKSDSTPYTGACKVNIEPIDWRHALASAAVPIIFPSVRIGPYFYTDGSIRQNTPMSPAIQLGADKILIIGVKYNDPTKQTQKYRGPNTHPSLTRIFGVLADALFLDHIEYDVEQMTRINRIIEWGEMKYGEKFLDEINQMLLEKGIRGDIANRGLKKIEAFSLFPSKDLGKLACERLLQLSRSKKTLNRIERFFLRFLEIDPNVELELLSYLMFDKEYLHQLIEIGIADCQAKEEELSRFLTKK